MDSQNSHSKLGKFFLRGDTTYIIGVSLLVVAFICVWLGWHSNYILYLVGFASAIAGFVLFFIGGAGRVGQEDIDKAVADKLWEFDKVLLEDIHIGRRISRHLKSVLISQYDYEGEGLMSKRGKDGEWRTTSHTALRLIFLKDAIVFVKMTVFPLADDSETDSSIREIAEYKYSALAGVEIIRDSVRLTDIARTHEVRRARLKITGADGQTLLLAQVGDGLDSDTLAGNINKSIRDGYAL